MEYHCFACRGYFDCEDEYVTPSHCPKCDSALIATTTLLSGPAWLERLLKRPTGSVPRPFGGWLVVPTLAMSVGWALPMATFGEAVKVIEENVPPGSFTAPSWTVVFALAASLVLIAITMAYLGKFTIVPLLMVVYYGINLASAVFAAAIIANRLHIPLLGWRVVIALLWNIGWASYFLRSARVRETFVR